MKMKFYVIPIFFLFSCGNPAIIRYIEPVNPLIKEHPGGYKNPLNHKFKIFEKDGISIYIKNVTSQDIDQTLKAGNNNNISYRIPAITYIKFIIQNESTKDININFFNTRLINNDNKEFKVLQSTDFTREFTSAAYQNFHFEKIFSFYVNLYVQKPPKNGYFYEKNNPGVLAKIRQGYTAEQIVPFQRISENFLEYTLSLEISDLHEKIIIPLRYTVNRLDKPVLTQ